MNYCLSPQWLDKSCALNVTMFMVWEPQVELENILCMQHPHSGTKKFKTWAPSMCGTAMGFVLESWRHKWEHMSLILCSLSVLCIWSVAPPEQRTLKASPMSVFCCIASLYFCIPRKPSVCLSSTPCLLCVTPPPRPLTVIGCCRSPLPKFSSAGVGSERSSFWMRRPFLGDTY